MIVLLETVPELHTEAAHSRDIDATSMEVQLLIPEFHGTNSYIVIIA
jgi:hypothetical protein